MIIGKAQHWNDSNNYAPNQRIWQRREEQRHVHYHLLLPTKPTKKLMRGREVSCQTFLSRVRLSLLVCCTETRPATHASHAHVQLSVKSPCAFPLWRCLLSWHGIHVFLWEGKGGALIKALAKKPLLCLHENTHALSCLGHSGSLCELFVGSFRACECNQARKQLMGHECCFRVIYCRNHRFKPESVHVPHTGKTGQLVIVSSAGDKKHNYSFNWLKLLVVCAATCWTVI